LLHLIEVAAASVDRSLGVTNDDVLDRDAGVGLLADAAEELGDGSAGSACAVDDDLDGAEVSFEKAASIDKGGKEDDGGSVLVIVEDGDAEILESFLDFKAARGGDVFEVNSSEDGGDSFDGFDDFLRVLGIETNGPSIDIGVFFKEESLAFHDGNGGTCADVSES